MSNTTLCNSILVVEDEADLRETIKDLLEIRGFQVCTAGNGQEGLRLLDKIGAPCLILLDLMMPVMNGWEFLDKLKRERQQMLSSVPIIVISAAADLTEVSQRYGCKTMGKPVKIEQLMTLAQEYC